VHDYAYQIFDLISGVSPLAIFLLVGCIPVKLIMNASRKTLLSIKKKELDTNKNIKGASSRNEKHGITKRRCQNKYKDTHNYYLFLVVSASIGYSSNYTHPSVNRNNQQIGSDSDSYMNWTHALNRSNSAANFTKQAFFVQSSGERPVSLIFIYGGQYSLLTIIEQLPLIGTCAHFS
jgi:hypothetical protein